VLLTASSSENSLDSRVQTFCVPVLLRVITQFPGISKSETIPSESAALRVTLPNPSWLSATTLTPDRFASVSASVSWNSTSIATEVVKVVEILLVLSLLIVIACLSSCVLLSESTSGATTTTQSPAGTYSANVPFASTATLTKLFVSWSTSRNCSPAGVNASSEASVREPVSRYSSLRTMS